MLKLPAEIRALVFLVVDDYESMRVMISEHLRTLGVDKILFAESGSKAFEIIQSGPEKIDFVLTDMVMEEGTGIELVKRLRLDPKNKSLPILMITSKAEVTNVLEAVKAGVSNYLVKPWEMEELHKKIINTHLKSQQ